MLKSLSPPQKQYLKASVFWSIRQGFPRWLSLLLAAVLPLLVLGLWALLSYTGWVQPQFLPTPTATLQAAVTMFTADQFSVDILASTARVAGGFLAAALVGIPVGIAMGTFQSMESFFSSIVGPMRYVPIVALVPLIVLWVGLDEAAKIMIIFLGIAFYNMIMIADAVKFIPDEMLNVAYTLGATRKDVLFRVILPAVFPSIIDTLRVNIAGAWNYLVVAELLAAENGLGFSIIRAQRFLQTEKVLVGIVVISVIGLLIDYAFKVIAQLLTPWAENSRA